MAKKNFINIYNNLVKFSRNKLIFSSFTQKDTFSDRLMIFLLHFAFFLKIYKNNENHKEMQNIYQHVKPIKKKYFNYFLEDSYRIKKKEIDIKKIKDELIKNNLIFL